MEQINKEKLISRIAKKEADIQKEKDILKKLKLKLKDIEDKEFKSFKKVRMDEINKQLLEEFKSSKSQ
jgi:hypothetical protein